jgi:hypothetical protein
MEQTNKTLLAKSEFLGAVEKFRKATMSVVMFSLSVCPHGTSLLHWTDFHEILIFEDF